MKKLTMIFVTVLMVALMVAGSAPRALADPGWSNAQRYGNRDRDERAHYRYDRRDYREYYRAPVVVHRVPVRLYEPVVRVYEPYAPGFGLYFPNFSIQIR